jgi:hypothetical protein
MGNKVIKLLSPITTKGRPGFLIEEKTEKVSDNI